MGAVQALLAAVRAIVRPSAAGRAIAALSPHMVWYAVSADPLVLKLALVSISLLAVMERIAASLPLLLLHGALVMAGIGTVSATVATPLYYVVVCMLLAFGSAAVMVLGERCKALGTFTLVPSLYVGSELQAGGAWLHLARLWPVAVLPVLLVVLGWQGVRHWRERGARSAPAHAGRVARAALLAACRLPRLWPPALAPTVQRALAWRMALARALGAALGATWVVLRRPEWGEWVVWSTASVVAGDWLSCQVRWRDRMQGLALGLPLGALAAYGLPSNAVVFGCAALAVYLSLVSFNTYRHAYLVRCTMLVLGAGSALRLEAVARWRAENVAIGCAIGIAMAFIVHHAVRGPATPASSGE